MAAYSTKGLPPICLFWMGRCRADTVDVCYDGGVAVRTAAIEELIEQTWCSENQAAEAEGRVLYDSQLLRLVRFAIPACGGACRLGITVGPTTYREFVCTNLRNANVLRSHGGDILANALGVSSVVVTSDGALTFGRRSHLVASHQGFLHNFGGILEFSDRVGESVNWVGRAHAELTEELGVGCEEIKDSTVIALIEDWETWQPELVCETKIRLSSEQLRDAWKRAPERDEHLSLEFVWDRADCDARCVGREGPITAAAMAAMMVERGTHAFPRR